MRIASVFLARGRPFLKGLLPDSMHESAGRLGRKLTRSLDRKITCNRWPDWPTLNWGDSETASDNRIVMVGESLQPGGAEYQMSLLAKGLQEGGYGPVGVFGFRLSEGPEHQFHAHFLAECGVEVRDIMPVRVALELLRERLGDDAVRSLRQDLEWAPSDTADDIVRLVGEFARKRPEIVMGWQDATGLVAAVAASIAGVRRIVVATRNVNPSKFGYYRPHMGNLYRRLHASGKVQFTNNSTAGGRDYAEWLGINPDAFKVVRNGIPDSAGHLREVTRTGGQAVIGGIFRLDQEKRPLLWLECAALVRAARPETRFKIVGDGPMRAAVERHALRLGIADALELTGRKTNAAALLPEFDLLLLVSAHEGTPNVILEAARSGVPVVATDVGGTRETIRHGKTGLLVSCDGETSAEVLATTLAKTVIAALDDESLSQSVRREGPAFVQAHFGYERMIEDWRTLLMTEARNSPHRPD